jgi:hypothetical protein
VDAEDFHDDLHIRNPYNPPSRRLLRKGVLHLRGPKVVSNEFSPLIQVCKHPVQNGSFGQNQGTNSPPTRLPNVARCMGGLCVYCHSGLKRFPCKSCCSFCHSCDHLQSPAWGSASLHFAQWSSRKDLYALSMLSAAIP